MGGSIDERPNVIRIAITGGPCAGKTSALEALRMQYAQQGIPAVFVPEAATDLINDGIAPWTCASMLQFQTRVIGLQLVREAAAISEAAHLGPSALLICDRGICDSRAYLNEDEYRTALAENGLQPGDDLARYDAVFHLESIAKADLTAYTNENNGARFENAAEAVDADNRTHQAWAAHPHLRVLPCQLDFNHKLADLSEAILNLDRQNTA